MIAGDAFCDTRNAAHNPILWTHEIIQTTVFFCLRCETKWKNRFVRAFTCRISITLKSDKRKGVWHWSTNDLSMDFCQLQDQSTRYNTKIWSPSYHHFWRFLTESLLIKENHILLETESWLRFSSYKKIGELCSVQALLSSKFHPMISSELQIRCRYYRPRTKNI